MPGCESPSQTARPLSLTMRRRNGAAMAPCMTEGRWNEACRAQHARIRRGRRPPRASKQSHPHALRECQHPYRCQPSSSPSFHAWHGTRRGRTPHKPLRGLAARANAAEAGLSRDRFRLGGTRGQAGINRRPTSWRHAPRHNSKPSLSAASSSDSGVRGGPSSRDGWRHPQGRGDQAGVPARHLRRYNRKSAWRSLHRDPNPNRGSASRGDGCPRQTLLYQHRRPSRRGQSIRQHQEVAIGNRNCLGVAAFASMHCHTAACRTTLCS
mmetsp:Transcript_41614/g.120670  ORF Transcript_41614/g.120670 Transcript_41614/m.120670 type:complete len:267 (-) Transcript_41614:446-1246(-)